MDDLSIGELARQAGLRTSAVRYYESVGLLPAPRRVGGRRRYDERTLHMLALIRLAQQAGFAVTEIQTLFAGFAETSLPGEQWRALVTQKLGEINARIAQAQRMQTLLAGLLRCGHARLEDCLISDGTSSEGAACQGC
ncbi:MAG TPA: MerR family transcriptional regulator [Roseiflexaceae bacterium]|nr:MerR family transcriptional regulator [Roseiflexaceae bacterium]